MITLGFAAFFMAWLTVSDKATIFAWPRRRVMQWAVTVQAKYRRSVLAALGWIVEHLARCIFCAGTHFAWILVLLAEPWSGPRTFFVQWMTVAGVSGAVAYVAIGAEALDEGHG